MFFLMFFLFNLPWGWSVIESERALPSWRHIGWRNTKICIHEASWMERKLVKCWKLPNFEGKLRLFFSYLSEMKKVSMFYNFLIPVLFTACFYHFLLWRYLNSIMRSFFCQTFCFHFQIQMIWTAVVCKRNSWQTYIFKPTQTG